MITTVRADPLPEGALLRIGRDTYVVTACVAKHTYELTLREASMWEELWLRVCEIARGDF